MAEKKKALSESDHQPKYSIECVNHAVFVHPSREDEEVYYRSSICSSRRKKCGFLPNGTQGGHEAFISICVVTSVFHLGWSRTFQQKLDRLRLWRPVVEISPDVRH